MDLLRTIDWLHEILLKTLSQPHVHQQLNQHELLMVYLPLLLFIDFWIIVHCQKEKKEAPKKQQKAKP